MQRIYIYTGNRPVSGNGDSKYKSYVEEYQFELILVLRCVPKNPEQDEVLDFIPPQRYLDEIIDSLINAVIDPLLSLNYFNGKQLPGVITQSY